MHIPICQSVKALVLAKDGYFWFHPEQVSGLLAPMGSLIFALCCQIRSVLTLMCICCRSGKR